MFPPINEQLDIIKRTSVEIIPEDDLIKKLTHSIQNNRPLIIKLGCDPSRPDLHIGHSVVLQKLRDFQDLGHKVILIIGDFTGHIGDPSGRNKTRPPLSLEETRINGQSYYEQATKILSEKNLEIRYNSEWLDKMSFSDVIKLASKYTVARMLERDDFEKRLKEDLPISLHELLYPLSQAMDSVAIKSDVEIGGTDQKFNFLVGRDIQEAYGLEPQVIITLELLEGTDGIEKMSKSLNNAICFNDSPKDIFGKTMSIPDGLIYKYFRLCTLLPAKELDTIKSQLNDKNVNPRDLKARLGYELVKKYYDEDKAKEAQAEFENIFGKKGIPDEKNIPEYLLETVDLNISTFLKESGLTDSTSASHRFITAGAVTIDGEKVTDPKLNLKNIKKKEFIIKVGKRKFLKVKKNF